MNFLYTDLMKMVILLLSFVISNIKVAADKIKYDISWNPEVTEKWVSISELSIVNNTTVIIYG